MKGFVLCVLTAGVLMGIGGASAAEAPAKVARVYNDNVAPADQLAYLAGVKNYNKCLADHGFQYVWTAWAHETGDVYAYSYVSDPGTWAAFDDMHKQAKACDATFQTQVNPHLKGETSAFVEDQADMSYANPKGMSGSHMDVTYFKLKNAHGSGKAFTEAVKKVAAAAAKSHWSNYFRFLRVKDGGPAAPDFMVVTYSTSWAEFGTDANPTMMKMVEGVYGKDGAEGIWKALGDSIEDQSSHVDSLDEELTYRPAAH